MEKIMKIKTNKLREDRVKDFYEVFGYSIRNQILIQLLVKGSLPIWEMEASLVNNKKDKIENF